MGQMARDRVVIRGLLCSAWRAVTIPICARGAQVADNQPCINFRLCAQLLSITVVSTRVHEFTFDSPQRPSQRLRNWE